jgi:hypothetical protein
MAFTACPECGREISTAAATCPGCGAPVARVNPPPLPAMPPPLPIGKKRSKGLWVAIAALFVVVCLVIVVITNALNELTSNRSAESKIRATLISELQKNFAEVKQQRYEKVHVAGGFGKAKDDVIQDVSIRWKSDRPTDNPTDISGFTVDHTLYWETPVTTDGYTRFNDTFDCSSGSPQLVDSKILATNGITVEGATNAFIHWGTKELTKAISGFVNGTPAPDSKQ